MDTVDFASRLYKNLRRRQEDIQECLTADGVPNWEEYKKLVGEIRGLSYAADEAKALLEKYTDHDEETFGP